MPSCRISEAIGRRLRSEHCHWLSRWQLAPLECVLRFGQLGEFRTFRTNCPASTTCALALSIAEFGWQDARLLRELPGRFRRQCLSRRNSWRRSTATHRRRHPLVPARFISGCARATAGCSTDSRSDFACSITVSSQQGEELQENAVSGSVKKCKLGRPGESAIASQSRQNKGSRE